MNNRKIMELWVGVFAIAGIAALTMLALKVGNLGSVDVGESYQITARFANIGQLKVKAPITMAGVRVGRVSNITIDDSLKAVVTLSISDAYKKIPSDTGASIRTAGLLGEQYIALKPGSGMSLDPDSDESEYLKDGDEVFLTSDALVLEDMIGQFLYDKAGDTPKE
ncbi:MAG: outer membrane lipid asymmetry maintenance protein MlaD [Gammaproteobacteria bacterium]|nr:outer membrane lipid asymmetry maintenance protein MlaD [Gammaproteobacteria bacterium]